MVVMRAAHVVELPEGVANEQERKDCQDALDDELGLAVDGWVAEVLGLLLVGCCEDLIHD